MRRGIALAAVCALGGWVPAVATSRPARSQERRAAAVQVRHAATVSRVVTASRRLWCRRRRRRFQTLPDLRPTTFCVAVRRGAEVAPENILVTPRPNPKRHPDEQFGLMLISSTGKLLWFMRRPGKVHDLKTVTYRGRRTLAFYQRTRDGGYYQLLDRRYRPVVRIRAFLGDRTDEHELQLTGKGTAYVGSDPVEHVDGVGSVRDYVAQEVDIRTGKVLFQWRALDGLPLGDSYESRPAAGPWDFFHGNSIDLPTAHDPTLMISSRNASAVYGVDRRTGRTQWILGGRRDQFGLARHPGWVFCTQHDARRLPDGRLLLFDNGGSRIAPTPQCPVHPARALLFRLDVEHRHVRLLRSITSVGLGRSGRGFLSGWMGSARPLSNGDVLIDWGQIPRVSAIGPGGREKLVLRMRFWSYRAVPAEWVGRPLGRPAMVARRRGDGVRVWASWNGATEIRSWQVLAGPGPRALAPLGAPASFQDLETRIRVRTHQPWLAVRALNARGSVLGRSRAVKVGRQRSTSRMRRPRAAIAGSLLENWRASSRR
jgi:arylsulfotransferase ASST